ncbi:MAG: MaoC family dehydratase N-terminal domain-containing protein [Hyphomicrobiaceae bacterium]
MTSDERYASAIGRTECTRASLDAGPADRLTAALDYADPAFSDGDVLPHAWHWLYFHAMPRASLLSADGRGASGGLMPPFPGLARMWAGGSFTFLAPLRIGETIERRSQLASITEKSGRSGPLVVTRIEHDYAGPTGSCVRERQEIVLRQPTGYSGAADGERATTQPSWSREIIPDEVLLFCFSALTYNPHRIHYDLRYATEAEGYPGLLVQGPLTCVLLLDLIRRSLPDRPLAAFEYRAMRPLICGRALALKGAATADSVEVWAEDDRGLVAMRGRASFA